MFEEKDMRHKIAAMLAIKLIALNYQVKCGSDVQKLYHILAYGSVDYISTQESLLVAFHNALTCVIDEIADYDDPFNLAMLETAVDLQSQAMEVIDEIDGNSHLERIPE